MVSVYALFMRRLLATRQVERALHRRRGADRLGRTGQLWGIDDSSAAPDPMGVGESCGGVIPAGHPDTTLL